MNHFETFMASIDHYRAQQYKIAIDDYGSGYSSLNRVCAFSPEFLKLDRQLVHNIDKDALKKSAVSATIGFCKESGIKVIAEGIETAEELETLIHLGADYGQGYYLAYPTPDFLDIEEERKAEVTGCYQNRHQPFVPCIFGRVSSISQLKPTYHISEPSLTAYMMMKNNPQITEFFVVDDQNCVCGILPRSYILEKFGGEFGYNLSKRLPVERIMRTDFLAMETYMSIEEVASIAMQRKLDQIYDAISVTEQGKYVGTVSVKDLLLTAVQMQVRRATDSNPLTGLPGNTMIQERIEAAFREEIHWAIIYLDLDNFKAYNDAYGFSSGDLMIKAVSESIKHCSTKRDFIGHIGGDDFVIVSSCYQHVEDLCQRICQSFREKIKHLYSAEDWSRGYIRSLDRNGFKNCFPIATLSIAVVTNRDAQPDSLEELSKKIAETKKLCKQQVGDFIKVV